VQNPRLSVQWDKFVTMHDVLKKMGAASGQTTTHASYWQRYGIYIKPNYKGLAPSGNREVHRVNPVPACVSTRELITTAVGITVLWGRSFVWLSVFDRRLREIAQKI
jgi:hypothetical protein